MYKSSGHKIAPEWFYFRSKYYNRTFALFRRPGPFWAPRFLHPFVSVNAKVDCKRKSIRTQISFNNADRADFCSYGILYKIWTQNHFFGRRNNSGQGLKNGVKVIPNTLQGIRSNRKNLLFFRRFPIRRNQKIWKFPIRRNPENIGLH